MGVMGLGLGLRECNYCTKLEENAFQIQFQPSTMAPTSTASSPQFINNEVGNFRETIKERNKNKKSTTKKLTN
jgi:hypothetical protein